MKTKFFSFSGGLMTGMFMIFLLPSSYMEKGGALLQAHFSSDLITPPDVDLKINAVRIDDFYQDVARYYGTHWKLVRGKMPQNQISPMGAFLKNSKTQDPSRMFIYSVNTLEQFFVLIKKYGREAHIDPKLLAIRFYYGVYPGEKRIAGEEYGSLHTLLMVPNYWSEKYHQYKDLDIKQLADYVTKNHGYGHELPEKVIEDHFLQTLYNEQNMNEPGRKDRGIFMLDASSVQYTGDYPVKKAGFLPMPSDPPVINQGQMCPPTCSSNTLLDVIDKVYPDLSW